MLYYFVGKNKMKDSSKILTNQKSKNIQIFNEINKVLWITMFLNLIPTILKLFFGYRTQSLSLIAGGFDSFFDSMTNIIGLIGIRIASKPADKEHPYGHRKAETFTALIISYILFITCYQLINNAIEQIRNPSIISSKVEMWSFIVIVISLITQSIVVYYELTVGRKLKSDILIADALHSRADVFASLSLIISQVLVFYSFALADPIFTILIVLVIVRMGIEIIIEAIPTLLDKNKLLIDKVEEIALTVVGVRTVHNIRSRGHEEAIFADLHIQVDPTLSIDESHRIAHEIEQRLQSFNKSIQDVTVHVETDIQSNLNDKGGSVSQVIRLIAQDNNLELVHIWAVEIEKRYNIELHISHKKDDLLSDAIKINKKLEGDIRKKIPNIQDCILYFEPFKKNPLFNQTINISEEIQTLIQMNLEIKSFNISFDKIKLVNTSEFSKLYVYLIFPEAKKISDIVENINRLEKLISEVVPNHFHILVIPELK